MSCQPTGQPGVYLLILLLSLPGIACTEVPSEAHPEKTGQLLSAPRQTILTVDVSPAIPPMPATPTAPQLAWQRGEMYLFIHFGMNTFTGRERGLGTENPAWFNSNWISVKRCSSTSWSYKKPFNTDNVLKPFAWKPRSATGGKPLRRARPLATKNWPAPQP